MKIAISGKSGCGNTTVSKLLAEKLNLQFINFTFRNLAVERGVDLNEILSLAANDDNYDKEIDTRQVAMAREAKTGCVLGSRLAIWMLTEADMKVYLKAEDDSRVRRIQKREGGNFDNVKAFTKERDTNDTARYKRIYNIDNNDYSFADLIIDTDKYMPQEIVEIIWAHLKT
jgi:cytidylate kinase